MKSFDNFYEKARLYKGEFEQGSKPFDHFYDSKAVPKKVQRGCPKMQGRETPSSERNAFGGARSEREDATGRMERGG